MAWAARNGIAPPLPMIRQRRGAETRFGALRLGSPIHQEHDQKLDFRVCHTHVYGRVPLTSTWSHAWSLKCEKNILRHFAREATESDQIDKVSQKTWVWL